MNILLNNIKSLLVLFVFAALVSCNKDKESEGKYTITYYPEIEILGDKVLSTIAGEAFEDPGAVATENGEEIEYTVSGSVNVNEPGLYTLTYTAYNKDGFAKSETRDVFVIPGEVVPGSPSLVGSYLRTANGRTSKVTAVAPGVYWMTDVWGSATSGGNPLPIGAYLMSIDGEEIVMPYIYTGVSNFGDVGGEGYFDGTKLVLTTELTVAGAVRDNIWVKQ